MKKIFFILTFKFLAVIAIAQSIGLPLSSNQQLIEDAVKDGLFIVHQCYQLKDTSTVPPMYYGLNNKSYYGHTYSLGVKIVDGYYSDDIAIHPWLHDQAFDEYRNSNQYAPVISESSYKQVDDTAYIPLPKDKMLKSIVENHIYYIQDSIFGNKGFHADYTDGLKKGWLVWAITDKYLLESDTLPISLLTYRMELIFESGKELYNIKEPTTNKKILGGIYILPDFTEIGKITFKIAGVLYRDDNQWEVVRLADSNVKNSIQPMQEGNSSLTPIPMLQDNSSANKSKKDKKKK